MWWIPLLSVLLGGVLTIVGTICVEWYRSAKKGKSIESALISEIRALIDIAEQRKYQSGFNEIIFYLSAHSDPNASYKYTVLVPPHYSRIYQNTAKDIGLLKPDTASEIVKFHQLIDSVVQDISPGGVISNGAGVDAFKQTARIFEMAVETGKKLIGNSP